MGFILSNYARVLPIAALDTWMCDIFMPARFGPIFMSRFACKHVKSKKHEKGNKCCAKFCVRSCQRLSVIRVADYVNNDA